MSLSKSPSNDRSWPQFSPGKKDFLRERWLLAIYLPTETNMGATSRAQNIPLPTSVRIGRLGSAILAYKTSTSSLTLCHMPATPSATHGKVFHSNPVITLYLYRHKLGVASFLNYLLGFSTIAEVSWITKLVGWRILLKHWSVFQNDTK